MTLGAKPRVLRPSESAPTTFLAACSVHSSCSSSTSPGSTSTTRTADSTPTFFTRCAQLSAPGRAWWYGKQPARPAQATKARTARPTGRLPTRGRRVQRAAREAVHGPGHVRGPGPGAGLDPDPDPDP